MLLVSLCLLLNLSLFSYYTYYKNILFPFSVLECAISHFFFLFSFFPFHFFILKINYFRIL